MPQKVTYKMIHTLYKVKNTIHTHRFERDTQSKGGMKYTCELTITSSKETRGWGPHGQWLLVKFLDFVRDGAHYSMQNI